MTISRNEPGVTLLIPSPPYSQHPETTPNHAHETPTPRSAIHYKQQVGSIPEEESDISFIKQGKILAHTINLPFTKIPGIPAATPVLRRIDKATGQDLGFTYKGSVSSEENAQGGTVLRVKVDYIGFGFMSNKFNAQVAPLAEKIGVGEDVYKGFGCNLSTLTTPIGLTHERLGAKATVTDCNGTSKSISVAGEISAQKSRNFKPVSTATYGYFFGNDATLRIPAEYVPTLKRIKEASPNLAEWKIIGKRIGLSIPAIPLTDALDSSLQTAGAIAKTTGSAITSKIKNLTDEHRQDVRTSEPLKIPPHPDQHSNPDQTNGIHTDWMMHPVAKVKTTENLEKHPSRLRIVLEIKPSVEEKANYVVQPDDTLEQIGRKTGHSWIEILELNKNLLKNNPDKIYPRQELLIPENCDHAALINHPLVQARIRENMAKQQANEYTR